VEYEFAREIPKNIEVEIQGVANHFNKAMEKEVIVPSEFKDDYAPMVISSTAKVKITKAEEAKLKSDFPAGTDAEKEALKKALDKGRTVKTQEMTITFDKDIKEFVEYNSKDSKVTKADLVSHFVLYELDITRRGQDAAKAVEINIEDVDVKDVKNDRIKISFDGIKLNNKDRDYDYILEVRDFSDTNRNRMEREYLDFQVVRITSDFNVTMDPAKIRHTDFFNRAGMEIVLEFNDHVNKEEASNARNYYLDGKLDVDEAIVERDGKTVSLVVYDIKDKAALLAKYKVLEISPRVKDLSDPAVSTANRFIELKTGDYKDPITPVEVSAFTFSDATGPLTAAQLKGYEVAQNTTGSAMKMNIVYTGVKNDVMTAKLVDKDGKTIDMERTVLTTTSGALNVDVPLNKATTYTLKVDADGKVYNLPIRVLGTSTDIVVEYDGVDITAAALASAGKDLVAGEKFTERKLNIKLADGVVVKDMSKVETAKGIYKVIVTSETGVTVVHTVRINEVL
jgi:phosphopantetheinyl transferase (holo-ACP synthase)